MNLHSSRWIDLIFENRPKDYGAYRLRMTSSKRHVWSFVFVVGVIALTYGLYSLYENISYQQFQKEEQAMMVEQYELLNAILDEELMPQEKQPNIPTPIEATTEIAPTSSPTLTFKNNSVEIIDENYSTYDPYLEELLQDEKKEKEKKDQTKTDVVDNQLYTQVDAMPSFPGGEAGLMAFMAKNLRFPYSAQQKKIQNTVLCSFFIEKDGTIKQVDIIISVDPILDREAIRVIKALPRWQPARKNGKPIRTKYILPVSFRLK